MAIAHLAQQPELNLLGSGALLNADKEHSMALTTGTTAPTFTAPDDAGNPVSLVDFKGKIVVLYFYPKDDTPGCTKEAQSFRDNYSEYQGKDIVVLGVSRDDAASHQAFKEKYGLPFTLVADADGSITSAYDVDGGGYSKRVTYVINGDGVIDHVFESVKTDTHALDILAQLGA
jgi:thioredoxin-dependent peroxiredoxin